LFKTNGRPLFSQRYAPKQRAQYSHPDMELVYTALSYYHEGLTESQLKAALECSSRMGPVAQEDIYRSGSAARGKIYTKSCQSSDHILKVDVGNKLQLGLIHENPELHGSDFFWTDNLSITDTHQFLSKRATSAWNLVIRGKPWDFRHR
jgi:hypothetical protein